MRFLVAIALGVMPGLCAQPSSPEALALADDLGKEWGVLTVSAMINQGCVAPIYCGVRIRRSEAGITIASWREENEKQVDGEVRKLTDTDLKKALEAVITHYRAAQASVDIHEHIASLPTEEARKAEWVRVMKAAGGTPIGGFGSDGIDIRIQGLQRIERRYRDNYGASGRDPFHDWLKTLGMKWGE
jgi:hypothetical protein